MIKFYANVIEQLDFAVDHVALPDVNYKRLALVLIDNAMELVLHEYARIERTSFGSYVGKSASFQEELLAALGQRFEAKVKFGLSKGLLSQHEGQSINTLHSYRNEVYHQGVMHETILHALAMFYFGIVCDVLGKFSGHGYSWNNRLKVPHRAIKYIGSKPFENAGERIPRAWSRLKEVASAIPFNFVNDLHAEFASFVDEADRLIDYLVGGIPGKPSRDKVVMDALAWNVAFTEAGKDFARSKNYKPKTLDAYVEWLKENYSFGVKKDPIASWRKRLEALRVEKDFHVALKKYKDLVQQSEAVRTAVEAAAASLDAAIDRQVDHALARRHVGKQVG